MIRTVKIHDQISAVKTYLTHCTSTKEKINYSMTSFLWAKEVSRWAGIDISGTAIIEACKACRVKSVEITTGVFCYGLEKTKR